jgi:predicted DCC family thiol-disulfide oxidoreductase YuxK
MFLKSSPIIFYDGDCALCNKLVQFVLSHEDNNKIYFSSLSSKFALDFFKKNSIEQDPNTFYFYDGSKLLNRSAATLSVVPYLKWYFQFFRLGWIVPACFRDKVYNWIAKRRKKFFNNKKCLMPSATDKFRFLT